MMYLYLGVSVLVFVFLLVMLAVEVVVVVVVVVVRMFPSGKTHFDVTNVPGILIIQRRCSLPKLWYRTCEAIVN